MRLSKPLFYRRILWFTTEYNGVIRQLNALDLLLLLDPTAPNLGKYRLGLGGVMAIAASLGLLRRMHSPSCTYSPAAWQHQFFSLEGGGACLSVTIYNHRPDPEWTGRSRLSTGHSLYSVQNSSIWVHTGYSVQCRVHTVVLSIITTDTALPPPEVSGLEKRATRLHKKKEKKIVISCQLSDVFQPVDYLLISVHQWYCKSDMFAGDCSRKTVLRKKLSCTDARKVLPHHVPPPLSFFSCIDLSRCFPKGGSYSALCYHSCHQRVNRSSCRIRNESDAELWPEGGLQFRACGPPIPAKIIQVGAVCASDAMMIQDHRLLSFSSKKTPIHSVQFMALIDKWLFRTPYSSRQSR